MLQEIMHCPIRGQHAVLDLLPHGSAQTEPLGVGAGGLNRGVKRVLIRVRAQRRQQRQRLFDQHVRHGVAATQAVAQVDHGLIHPAHQTLRPGTPILILSIAGQRQALRSRLHHGKPLGHAVVRS